MVKFLIVRFSSIGDIVLTTPVLRHLKRAVPDAEIHYLVKKAYVPVLEANPYIDQLHAFEGDLKKTAEELKSTGIDYVIDLHHNLRSARIKNRIRRMDFSVDKLNLKKWLLVRLKINRMPELHMVDRNLATIRHFISKSDEEGLDYFVPEKDQVDPETLPESFRKGYIGLVIGAQHATKRLPTKQLIRLCGMLKFPVILLGGTEDRPVGEAILSSLARHRKSGDTEVPVLNSCGQYNINQSASLTAQCKLLISHDTGLMHIGAAFGKPILSIWGNTVPAFGMYPYRAHPDSEIFELEGLPCRPCSKIGYDRCPKKHFRCMMDQDLELIAKRANELMADRGL
ncbi:MAG: glycosyl transferase [Bacteroidetes bacterium]|nr:MAG: glycosyl transferase [Bacteroidota bacterium]